MYMETQTQAHCNQTHFRWELPQRHTMHSWAAGLRLQLRRVSHLTNRRHKAEPWTQRIRTGHEHAGHHPGEGQCLQARILSIRTHISRLRLSLHTRASRRTLIPCLGGRIRSQLLPPPPYSKHPLLRTKRQRRPELPIHPPMSSIWIRRQLCYPPEHLLSLNPYQRNLGHKAPIHSCKALFPNRKARRAPSHTPPNRPLRSNRGRISA